MKIESVDQITNTYQLDQEWVEMILEAIEVGISVDEIKEFLAKKDRSKLVIK